MMGVSYIGEVAPLDRPEKAIFLQMVAAHRARQCRTRSLCWLLCKEWAYNNLTHFRISPVLKILADMPLWCVRRVLMPAPCNLG